MTVLKFWAAVVGYAAAVIVVAAVLAVCAMLAAEAWYEFLYRKGKGR